MIGKYLRQSKIVKREINWNRKCINKYVKELLVSHRETNSSMPGNA